MDVRLNWGETVAVDRDGEASRVRFASGETIEAELLLACIGVKPRTAFLAGSGIDVREGILVDGRMRTNVPDVFAAGDVAEAADFFTGRKTVSPILPNAVAQGRIAGSNMADDAADYAGSLPMNTFNFFGHLAVSVVRGAARTGSTGSSSPPAPIPSSRPFSGRVGRRGSTSWTTARPSWTGLAALGVRPSWAPGSSPWRWPPP